MNAEIIETSKKLYPITGFNFLSLKNIVFRIRYIQRAKHQKELLNHFIKRMTELGYAQIFSQKPYMLGLLEWPYIHNKWDIQQRVHAILEHYQLLSKQPSFLNVADAQPKKILDLNEYSETASIILDRSFWFAREGEVVINLFKADLRVISIAFTIGFVDDELVFYVGAIQGIQADNDTLGLFKSLTKEFEGLRPRSMMVELLRMIAERVGAKKIWAISDACRHHIHPYFADTHKNTLKTGYDQLWLEHDGVLLENGFFEIPVAKHRRDISEVSSNKRAMYRRRYEMLDNIESSIYKLQSFFFSTFFSKIALEVLVGLTFVCSAVKDLDVLI